MVNRLIFASVALSGFLLGACTTGKPERPSIWDPKYLAIGFKGAADGPERARTLGAHIFGAVLDPSGSGWLVHHLCTGSGTCKVKVLVSIPNAQADPAHYANNNCGIRVPDVILVSKQATTISWNLVSDDPLYDYQFEGGTLAVADGKGVLVADNNPVRADDNQIYTPGAAQVFAAANQPTGVTHMKSIATAGTNLDKAFPYALRLQYRPKTTPASPWTDCDPYDPIIVNHGD